MSIDTNESLSELSALGAHLDDEPSTPLPPRQAPAFLNFMPPLVKNLWEKGVDFDLDSKTGELHLDGFYKNGKMRLVFDGKKFKAIDKRGREREVKSYEDLARLNFQWWRRANTRGQVTQPSRAFQDYFLAEKWVKRTVMYAPADNLPKGLVDDTGDDD